MALRNPLQTGEKKPQSLQNWTLLFVMVGLTTALATSIFV